MPASCCDPDYDATFDERAARRELSAYRRSGAGGSTRRLLDAILAEGVDGASVLDIGGGIGAIGMELLDAGATSLTGVDAARAYVSVSRDEADRRGVADRARFLLGDFVALAGEVEPADVVTLDRVVCCYGDWRALVDASAPRARRLYGLVYPRERWWTRLMVGAGNLVHRLIGRRYRFYVHPERAVDARIREHGFRVVRQHHGFAWQTVLYARAG